MLQQAEDRYSGVLSPLVDGLESVLKTMQNGLEVVGLPYAYGWSIVLLTVLVKVLTYPLTKQQVWVKHNQLHFSSINTGTDRVGHGCAVAQATDRHHQGPLWRR